jgi:hypothetical protein
MRFRVRRVSSRYNAFVDGELSFWTFLQVPGDPDSSSGKPGGLVCGS